MAGTRFWIQAVVLAELVALVWISVHVGFCRHPPLRDGRGGGFVVPRSSGLSPPRGLPVLPAAAGGDVFGVDPLCPLPHLREWFESLLGRSNNDDDDEAATAPAPRRGGSGRTNSSSSSPPNNDDNDGDHHAVVVSLRVVLVLEDASDVPGWSDRISREWGGVSSYLGGLDQVRFVRRRQRQRQRQTSPIVELRVVGPPAGGGRLHPMPPASSTAAVRSLWNHVASSVPSVMFDEDDDGDETGPASSRALLVLYVPSGLSGHHLDETKSELDETEPLVDGDHDAVIAEGGDGSTGFGHRTTEGPAAGDAGPEPPPVRVFGLRRNDGDGSSNDDDGGHRYNFDTWMLVPTTTDVGGHLGPLIDGWMMRSIGDAWGGDQYHDDGFGDDATTTGTGADGLPKVLRGTDLTLLPAWWRIVHDRWRDQTVRLYRRRGGGSWLSRGGQEAPAPSVPPILQRALSDAAAEAGQDRPDGDARRRADAEDTVVALQGFIAEWQDAHEWLVAQQRQLQRGRDGLDPDSPVEHYAAIFLPLLFPLLVPFLVSALKEYRRMRQKRNEAREKHLQGRRDAKDERGPERADADEAVVGSDKEKEA